MDDRAQPLRRPGRNQNGYLPLILLSLGVLLIVAAVLLVPMLFDRSDGSTTATAPTNANAGWARAYIYNGATGEGVAIDADGKVIERYGSMGKFIDSRVVSRSRSVAFLGETVEVGPIPEDGSGPGQYSLPVPPDGEVAVLGVPDRLVLAIHQPDGGNIIIVDVDSRRSLDVANLLRTTNPSYTLEELQLEPAGEQFAIYDTDTDETAVISFSRPQPRYYKNRALAISSDRVLTTRPDGRAATTTLYSSDGSIVTEFNSDTLVSATMDGHIAYLVTASNEIFRLEDGASEPVSLAISPDAEQLVIAQDGDRLIVDSPWGFGILNRDGTELGQLRPGSGGVENPARDSRCLATDINEMVTRDATADSVGRGPAVLDLDNLRLSAVTQLPIHSSTSHGCTVATEVATTGQYQLISVTNQLSLNLNGDIPVVGPYDRMFMSPNPNQWIAMLPDKSIRLFELIEGVPTELATIPFPDADYITATFIAGPANDG